MSSQRTSSSRRPNVRSRRRPIVVVVVAAAATVAVADCASIAAAASNNDVHADIVCHARAQTLLMLCADVSSLSCSLTEAGKLVQHVEPFRQ